MHADYNMPVSMRDGVRLSAAVFRPLGRGPFPAVLLRTCYTKWHGPLIERAKYWTQNGLAFIVQDVRGRGDSDGDFYPLVNERRDGLDTLDWIAARPWSDGRVVMLGSSYSGWTQLYLASSNHPALAALSPAATPPDPDRSFPLDRGMIAPSAAAWLATLDGHTNQDTSSADIDGAFARLPIIDFDKHIGRHLHAWRDWIETPPGSAYWRAQSYQSSLSESRIPMLHISGWYDDCLGGAIENFAALAGSERSPDLAANQWLLIGPWTHNSIGKRTSGGIDFGPSAELDVAEVQRNWFSARLGGSSEATAQVRLFVMGRNEWIEAREWPPAGTLHVRFYLHSSGGANSRLGDGALTLSPPMDEPPDRFTYDPCNPVPYAQDFDWKQVGGPDDCAELELRHDILVYTGAPLTEPLTICGPLIVRLFAATSAVDTDWTAKLLDVHPDGKAIRLNDGAVRARFRNGLDPQCLQCGAIEEYVIDCWATCIELPAGHRLRLEIASSAFGKFDVNMNGGGPIGREHQAVTAEQTVFHDRMRPSHILLPVLSTL